MTTIHIVLAFLLGTAVGACCVACAWSLWTAAALRRLREAGWNKASPIVAQTWERP